MCVCRYVWVYGCIYVCMYVYVSTYVCMYVSMYICVYVCMNVRMYEWVYVCFFACFITVSNTISLLCCLQSQCLKIITINLPTIKLAESFWLSLFNDNSLVNLANVLKCFLFNTVGIRLSLSLFSSSHCNNRWSTLCSLVPQGHVGVSVILNRLKYDLKLPCPVTMNVKL